ncbi:hypothetical protein [Legionella oakridgensis]|uniref:DUF4189 domain-containing protein n=2 Tax=Legionella oakridgensis TaxID=29423 RepID=W0BFG7_9GAMM|nr:hypothetical protein [Legionella oakridgensis]AHE67184.1 hypothetical protein Loa_01637 [Legionella oakridgensis ATCC 33761 = DSM 21215]ETO93152.1 hypothetical protein LOR_48c08840 [Legionella oakridgensis RV-2-2007]KTD38013.1 hypothetical protein Loak_1689 [Legionella oakridgensis]STY20265.1 Uncharacterised protein [Legionella longbeachae]
MKYASLLIYLVTTSLSAAIPPGQWQCFAFDSQERSYQGLGDTLQQAMEAAEAQCKNKSAQQHCKTAQSYCEQGPLSLIEDRCLVTDNNGHSWNATGSDACKTAMSLCTEWQFLHGKTSQCSIKHR